MWLESKTLLTIGNKEFGNWFYKFVGCRQYND